MARTIFAVFESKFAADRAVYELKQNGLPGDLVEVFARSEGSSGRGAAKRRKIASEIFTDELGAGMRIGAGIGGSIGAAGGLLAISGTAAIPFLAPLLAGDGLAAAGVALAAVGLGMAAGCLTGGLVGSLCGLGISDDELFRYARSVREDPVVVAVFPDRDTIDPIISLLEKHGPLELIEKINDQAVEEPAGKPAGAPRVQAVTRERKERR